MTPLDRARAVYALRGLKPAPKAVAPAGLSWRALP